MTWGRPISEPSARILRMFAWVRQLFGLLIAAFPIREDLILENRALR